MVLWYSEWTVTGKLLLGIGQNGQNITWTLCMDCGWQVITWALGADAGWQIAGEVPSGMESLDHFPAMWTDSRGAV